MICLAKIFFLFLLLIFPIQGFTQQEKPGFQTDQTFHFRHITIHEGLSQNWIRSIHQDNEGFMWFGASGGLNRYDGYEIKTYPLGNVNVNVIVQKSKNELWICTDLGIFIYNNENDSLSSFPVLTGQTVLSMIQEKDSTLWFGTNTGLYRYSPKKKELETYEAKDGQKSSLNNSYINKLFQDSRGNIWIGTKLGLSRYIKPTNSFENYQVSDKAGSLSGKDIMAICEDHKKQIWVGSAKDGVNLIIENKNEIHFKKITNGAILSLLVDNKNKLWIGTGSNGGVLQIDLNTFSTNEKPHVTRIKNNKINPKSLSDNSGFCIYQDALNDIWIGTYGGGVNYFSYRSKSFYTIKEGIDSKPTISDDIVNTIWDEEKFLWIGTEGGLDCYNKTSKTTKHFGYNISNPASLSSDPVYELLKDSRGNLWVGTWTGGLNLYNYQTSSFKRFKSGQKPGSISSENVFSIFEDSKLDLWIGTVGGGLNKYDYQTGTFKTFRHDANDSTSIHSDIIHDVNETKNGKLLIAAKGCLDIYNRNMENFSHYSLGNTTADNIGIRFILFIYTDSRNNIWLGTNEGLMFFDEKKTTYEVFSTRHGLAGNTVQGITEDDHENLWISTNKGLSKFVNAVNQRDSEVFINFNEYDGLSDNEFKRGAVFKNSSGQMFFGTSQGVTYFHPDSIHLNTLPPKVVFTRMQLLQQNSNSSLTEKTQVSNINTIDQIELPYNKSDFEISFSSLNYLSPQKNKYKYMLDGYDPNWVQAGNQRTATYKNLRPGKYLFKVSGSNNDEIWSISPKTLAITIHPPFWQKWWFHSILVLFTIGTIFLLFMWRIKIIELEKKKLEILVNKRTKELRNANFKLEEQSEELKNQNEELTQNQEQLSLYKDHLETLVVQRTAELEKAKNKAEESDKLKSSFLANISHEIRTPLNAITGFAAFFEDPSLDDETRKSYYGIIESNTETLLRLIDDILDLSFIESNQVTLININFSPKKTIHELYQQFSPLATNNVDFVLNISDHDITTQIYSDEQRFRQILINLLSNAFKFTEKGMVELGFFSNQNTEMVFYVKDTGIGISKKEQKIIFNYFTKIEKTAQLYRGVGLGLAICKQLTQLLGGKIWLESEPGKGSTFFFSQPILEVNSVS